MSLSTIRPARAEEYDEIARVCDVIAQVSTGLAEASDFLLAQLRARIPREVENGWSLFANDRGTLTAMLALHLRKLCSTNCSSCRNIRATAPRANAAGLHATVPARRDRTALRARKRKAWRWYEREGFVFEKEAVSP